MSNTMATFGGAAENTGTTSANSIPIASASDMVRFIKPSSPCRFLDAYNFDIA